MKEVKKVFNLNNDVFRLSGKHKNAFGNLKKKKHKWSQHESKIQEKSQNEEKGATLSAPKRRTDK